MKKLTVLLMLALLVLTACNPSGGVETTAPEGVGITTAPEITTEELTTEEETTPWHLSVPPEWELRLYDVPKEKENLYYRLPLVHEGEVDGFSLKFEFFQEFYPIGEPVQMRMSITNNTGEDISYAWNPGYLGYVIADGSGAGYVESIRTADLVDVDTLYYRELASGETVVYEKVMVVDPALVTADASFSLGVTILVLQDQMAHSYELPFSFVELDS